MAALTHGARLTRVQAGKLKVAELRKRLAGMGLSTDGLKQALVDRLIGALEEELWGKVYEGQVRPLPISAP